jgi:signal transduction histidine kinase
MRTKLFLAFLVVIITALVSNLIFERLIINDFEDYSMGTREDRLYWILASVEGSMGLEGWDEEALKNSLRWGALLGYDLKVSDNDGDNVFTTPEALADITGTMRRRLESLVVIKNTIGEFEEYPLFANGQDIGTLYVREFLSRISNQEKEQIFKRRGKNFLLISFVIAGGGALFLAFALSMFLTVPLKRLRSVADKVAGGDLSGRVEYNSEDEIGKLISSFNKMVESLEREESLRQRLTQNVAHELRTPLAVMRSHLEAITDGVIKCDTDAMDTMMSEVKRLINLVQGIESMTKAEASFILPSEAERVSLAEFITGAVAGMKPLYEEKGLELNILVDEKIKPLIETAKLETVLKNIVSNALRHTETGSVTIAAKSLADGGILIEVADTGQGIAEDKLSIIFKRFYKGDNSDGVGLGLAIAKELTESMGATIEVKSKVGVGTQFRIVLAASKKAK